jgi:stringent starvation protein B
MAIYSMEDGQGMMFAEDTSIKADSTGDSAVGSKSSVKKDVKKSSEKKKPGLKIVK